MEILTKKSDGLAISEANICNFFSQRGSIPLDREQIVDIPVPHNKKMAYTTADAIIIYTCIHNYTLFIWFKKASRSRTNVTVLNDRNARISTTKQSH